MHPHPFQSWRLTIKFSYYFTFLLFFLGSSLPAQNRPAYFDGPYIFQQADSLEVKWIESGVPMDTTIANADADVFERDSLPVVDLKKLDFPTDKPSTYSDVERIITISDVHGQYDLMRELLLASGVIDTLDNWALGQGHLVVVGDNLDRGEEVLPILWLFFKLEQQALAAGGRLHLLLGNHEMMVLQGDLRYLNTKYNYTAAGFRTPYNQLFAKGSVLGDWIAQHQVAVVINRHLFVHAGLSPEVLELELSFEEINRLFREQILRQADSTIYADPTLDLLYGNEGPLWYRGYFGDEALSRGKFRKQLRQYDLEKIVVGHTSLEEIQPLYGGQLIAIDCSIKLGQRGQVLLIEGGTTFTIDLDGEQLELVALRNPPTTSLQQTLMASSSRPRITIDTDFPLLIRRKDREEYQPLDISIQTDELEYNLPGRVRARGNMRKQVCYLPPLMIDLRKSDLDSLNYVRHDKLKLVIPCQNRNTSQENLLKEFLAYELYRQIDDHGMQTRLVDIVINGPRRQIELTGFLIETERDYSHRTGARALQSGRATESVVNRERFMRMMFFQYMIANCDWSVYNKHNLELVGYPDSQKPEFIAYDFDYSGFVGNSYAVPSPTLPIDNVNQRYFFSYDRTDEEIDATIVYFLDREEEIYAACAAADYLEERVRDDCQDYLRPFFDLLRNPRQFRREINRYRN